MTRLDCHIHLPGVAIVPEVGAPNQCQDVAVAGIERDNRRATGVPVFLADVIQGTALLAMLVALLFTGYRLRRVRRRLERR